MIVMTYRLNASYSDNVSGGDNNRRVNKYLRSPTQRNYVEPRIDLCSPPISPSRL